jgi:protein-disulfide isomerase
MKKQFAAALVCLAIAGFIGGTKVSNAEETISKAQQEQFEKIVHDYIVSHPALIMETVNNHIREQQDKQRNEAVQSNKAELFSNENSPYIGNKNGDVTLIEFFDYNCHYCKNVFPALKSLSERDGKIKIVFKDLPILGPTSLTAAKWALAAQLQGKYFQFHTALMEHQGALTDEAIEQAAKGAGLDIEKAKNDLQSDEITKQIDSNRDLAKKMGFNGTPAFVIGEKAFGGALDDDQIKAAVEEARQKSGKP